jgi:hypothetical protein
VNPYDVPAWSAFALGTAVVSAVVLAVAATHLGPLLTGPSAARAALTLAVPLCLSVVALCLLVPGQSATALGVEIVGAGAALGLAGVIWAGTTGAAPGEPRRARPATLVVVLVPVVLLLVGGTAYAVGSFGGLYWVFAATAAGLVGTAVNAGLLLAETRA